MSTIIDYRKSVRVIALVSGHPEIEKVNVISVAPSDKAKPIAECVQLTAAQAQSPHHKTVMPTASTVVGLRTIYISGYAGPN